LHIVAAEFVVVAAAAAAAAADAEDDAMAQMAESLSPGKRPTHAAGEDGADAERKLVRLPRWRSAERPRHSAVWQAHRKEETRSQTKRAPQMFCCWMRAHLVPMTFWHSAFACVCAAAGKTTKRRLAVRTLK